MANRSGPTGFPSWTHTVASMKAARDERPDACAVRVMCGACKEGRDVDLDALIATKGPDFSLINRRGRCRFTPGCRGWCGFRYQSGVMRPLWTERQAEIWSDMEYQERQRLWRARAAVMDTLSGNFMRLDPAPAGIDQIEWAFADDRERNRLIRKARD